MSFFKSFDFNLKMIVRAGIIAGLYVALTFLVFPVASGAIQFRASEALTLLPLIFVESVPALFVGCMISNIITGCALYDVIFGSLITLVAGILTYLVGRLIRKTPLKLFLGGLFPVILNAVFLPVIWYFCYGELEYLYILSVLFLLVSQSVCIYALGIPLYFATEKLHSKGII